jgi:preprotein translocase subunit Sec63
MHPPLIAHTFHLPLVIIITTMTAWFVIILKLNEAVVLPTVQRNKNLIEQAASKVTVGVKTVLVRIIARICIVSKRFYRLGSVEPTLLFFAFLALCCTFIFLMLVEQIDGVADDPYDILGVSHNATHKEIKTAFRALSLRYHCD